MSLSQAGILAPLPTHARFLSFSIRDEDEVARVLLDLAEAVTLDQDVVGLGRCLISALGREISGLESFPGNDRAGIVIPSTPAALWCWLRGDDPGELFHRARAYEQLLMPAFDLTDILDAYRYGHGMDLSGYEDGTENPKDQDAVDAAIVQDRGAGLDGSSFVAVQQWLHDLDRFEDFPADTQDHIIGRRRSDNQELADAPDSAHVKRTAQESFAPEAFVLRRSMSWSTELEGGLNFLAFGKSLTAYEALLNRMLGFEDGIRDALFRFTRPISGAYFWCPPVQGGKLDLRALDL